MIRTENKALLPSRTVTGWRICIDYRKLNKVTKKDHFPLSFLDQMIDRLARHEYYYFLTGIRFIIKSLYHRRTKRKQHLRARMVRFLLDECPLGYVTHRARFNVA